MRASDAIGGALPPFSIRDKYPLVNPDSAASASSVSPFSVRSARSLRHTASSSSLAGASAFATGGTRTAAGFLAIFQMDARFPGRADRLHADNRVVMFVTRL